MKDSLNKRMADATKSARPSLVPDYKPPAAKTEEVPDIAEVIADRADLARLAMLVEKSRALQQDIKDLELSRRPYTDEIKRLMSKHRTNGFISGGVPVSYYTSTRKTLNPVKLMSHGVSKDTIEECTDLKDYQTLRVGGNEKYGAEE